VSRLSFGYSKY
jgi:hypothetical protein